jgi:type IV secretion system protein VirB1
MKVWLVSCWLLLPLGAQQLTPQQFRALGRTCLPESDRRTVTALVRTESNFNPYALSLNRPESLAQRAGWPPGRLYLKRQPHTTAEARRWAEELEQQGMTLSVGLMQVNREHGESLTALLDPCRNLQIGWRVFAAAYAQAAQQLGAGQPALRRAISLYNSGSPRTGFRNGYVSRVLQNAR